MSDSDAQQGIVIERVFEAPPELVWQMWTEPEHFAQWYGPQGFTVPVAEMDVRVGGERLICMEMHMPTGPRQMWTTGQFTEVSPFTRLVYTESFSDAQGNLILPAMMGMPEEHPATTEVIVELEDLDGRTRMVMRHAGVPGADGGANEGWSQAFAKMAAYMKGLD